VEPEFTDVVNANGLTSGTRIVEREGRIQIVADTHIGISGVVSVDGSAGVDGGEVTMRAGGNITLHESALVTARGVGADSSGGTVNIWADHSAVAHRGALVDASAGDSGDGGFIEFSARDTVELAGGEFRADGHDGAAGSILIDPDHIVVSAHILRDGANYSNVPSGGTVASASLTLLADESITVSENIVISSRQVAGSDANAHRNEASTGQSGSLTLDAPDIVLGSGSAILAHGSNGHAGGDVRLQAHRTGGLLDVFSDTTAGISLTHATITGRNIDLSASAAHDSTFSPIVTKTVSARIDIDSSALIASGSLTIGAASDVNAVTPDFSPLGTIDVASVAAVDVHGNSQLSSGTDTHLSADSSVTAKALPGLPDFGELPGDAGVAIAIVDSQATVDLRDASTVDATGALDLVATNTVDVEAIADASASASTAVGGAVAVAVIATTTRAAILDSAGVTHADAVTLAAESSNHIVASATAAAGGAAEKGTEQSKSEETLADYQDEASTSDGGVTVAAAVAVSDLTSTTEAKLESDGEVNASGTVTVGTKALNQSEVSADGSSSDGGVGVGVGVALNLARLNNHATVAQTVNAGGLTVEARLPDGDAINRFTTSATSGAAASNVGVAGALAVSVIDNRTSARLVGPAPVGIGGGNLRLDTRNHSEVDVEAKPAEGGTSGDSVGLGASVA
ncbi:MAG TPA: leukotoxin LktA family filamentous adhesin, partial [Rhodocyclaceae bacterium]|nr:leukotoxin LktA family filamentous adhesin [Rhodocyclaceae bacterium]